MIMMADYINDRDAAWGFGNAVLYRMCLQWRAKPPWQRRDCGQALANPPAEPN